MSQLREAMAAVKASPKNPAAWITLGDLLASEGQGEKATQSYQRALQLEPTNQAAQRGLAQLIIQNTGIAPASRPAPPSEPSRATPPAAPSRPAPEPRRPAPAPEVRRPVVPPAAPQRRVTEEQESRPRPTPRREDSTAPRVEQPPLGGGFGKVAASTFEMRERPASPRKPSEGRLRAGLLFIAIVPLVCACAAVVVLARLF